MTTQPSTQGHTRWPLWGLLVFCGGISLTLSVMHAMEKAADGDDLALVKGFLIGIAPVIAAAFLAHLLTDPYASPFLKGGVGMVFLGGMALSVSAQKAVVMPFVEGDEGLATLFPIMLDLSTIVALLALSGVGYSYNRAVQLEALREELLPALTRELEEKFAAELAARETELRAELGRNKEREIAELRRELTEERRAELVDVRRELTEEHGRELAKIQQAHSEELTEQEQALRNEFATRWAHAEEQIRNDAEARIQDRVRDAEIAAEARVRLELTRSGTASKGPRKALGRGTKDDRKPQVSVRDRAAALLRDTPDMKASDLATALDCTPKYARDLIKELVPGRGNGQDETGEGGVRLHAVP
ncbi:hypothetical protein [Nonomuraea wenchangensis]|uniref:DUF2637 domain-containing protein n=1 Tax=Nonomuraea wenchangensis TaxID=568860 RepID=A0A1I0LU34_9ACTN|nr:hypothetical protein [Nonomuraea wenchangensis]SEU46690.1 hypothetical protein SAMN05421811_127120 [Nonomuraea wenchangensis]